TPQLNVDIQVTIRWALIVVETDEIFVGESARGKVIMGWVIDVPLRSNWILLVTCGKIWVWQHCTKNDSRIFIRFEAVKQRVVQVCVLVLFHFTKNIMNTFVGRLI